MRKWLAVSVLAVVFVLGGVRESEAWQPSGWVYFNYPYVYDPGAGDWNWLNTSDTLWVNGFTAGGWTTLDVSGMASGWSFFNWPYAYCAANGSWYFMNNHDTQWTVNLGAGLWSVFGTPHAGDYLIIDLAEGAAASNYPVSYTNAPPEGGWTDEYKTTKLVMRRIPAGTFMMGSPEGELGRYSDEAQRQVTLTKDYYMGVFEVTQRQWELVMGNKPSYFTNASYYASRPVETVSYYDIRENADSNSAISPNWPQSSAVGASSFVARLRAKTGLTTLDLPTEAQWERAARAGTTMALNSGKNLTNTDSCPNMSEVGRYWHNGGSSFSEGGDTNGGTAKVGSYLPNSWGLYDMHGNVWEWCLDWYETNHAATTDPEGAASGADRVRRGGSWNNVAGFCRSAIRSSGSPDYRGLLIGFRLSRTLP